MLTHNEELEERAINEFLNESSVRNSPPPQTRVSPSHLWQEAVAHFRQTAQLSSLEESWLLENPVTNQNQVKSILTEWGTYRSGRQNTIVTKTLSHALGTLQVNIEALDAIVGYPTQAVACPLPR